MKMYNTLIFFDVFVKLAVRQCDERAMSKTNIAFGISVHSTGDLDSRLKVIDGKINFVATTET